MNDVLIKVKEKDKNDNFILFDEIMDVNNKEMKGFLNKDIKKRQIEDSVHVVIGMHTKIIIGAILKNEEEVTCSHFDIYV